MGNFGSTGDRRGGRLDVSAPVPPVVFAAQGSGHWHAAWDGLQALGHGPLDEDASSGEVWQYMGTWLAPVGGHGRAEFRHRQHPTLGRLCVSVHLSREVIAS